MKLIKKEFVFPDRCPRMCHASTVLRVGDRLLVSWFDGEKEGADDVAVWLSVRDGGAWSTPRRMSPDGQTPSWNPVLFAPDDGTVMLFYKVGKTIPHWKTMFTVSHDGGEHWTTPEELMPGDDTGGRGPVKNKPIRLSDGTVMAPASTEQGSWRCFADILRDGTWEKHAFPVPEDEKLGVIQPTLWEYPAGHVHALMRSNQCRIYRSDSEDSGRTWCPVYPTELPNNNSGIDCVQTENGTLVLVCNPVAVCGGIRSPLSVFVSTDHGASFHKAMDLETDPREYSYPSVIADGNRVYVVYTYARINIAVCELECDEMGRA